MYYTIRFLDGLRDDIRSVVQVQRPSTLDTSCSLALLQEEVAGPASRRDARRPEAGFQWRPPPPRGPLPLPAPPRVDKPPAPSLVSADDKHAADSGKPSVDKFAALKAYRRARGLCDKCAERWRPGHQCATTVQLHVVQELMDLLSLDVGDHVGLSDSADTYPGSSTSSDQAHLFATLLGCSRWHRWSQDNVIHGLSSGTGHSDFGRLWQHPLFCEYFSGRSSPGSSASFSANSSASGQRRSPVVLSPFTQCFLVDRCSQFFSRSTGAFTATF